MTDSVQNERRPAASQFVATMAAANYPLFLALPNFVQVGSPTGEGIYIANPDFDVRYDQSFPLAQVVARAPTGSINADERLAEFNRIRNQHRRFPSWPAPRHPQHRCRQCLTDLDDLDRRRRAERAAAVARGDPADVVTEQVGHA